MKGADLRCDLCDVTSTDKDGHERHMNGKRHKEKLEGPKEPKSRCPELDHQVLNDLEVKNLSKIGVFDKIMLLV